MKPRGRQKLPSYGSPSLLVIARLVSSALSLASAPIIARAIGPEGRGLTAAAIAAIAITPILLSFGVPLEVRRNAALGQGANSIRTARILVCAALIPSIVVAWALTRTVFSGASHAELVMIFVSVSLTPISISWICDISFLVATEKFVHVFLLQLCQPVAYVGIIVVLWATESATVSTIILANIIGNILTFIVSIALVKVSLRGPYMPLWRLIRSGVRFMGSSLAEIASNRLDQLLVLPLIGPFQAGIYSVAATVALAPIALGQAIAASVYPKVARAEARERDPIVAQGLRAATLWSLSASVLIVALAPSLIPLVFGIEFAPSVPVLQVLAVGAIFSIIGYVASMLLGAQNRALAMTINQVIALSVAMGSLFLLAPALGAIGAAIASSVSFFLLSVLGIISLRVKAGNLVIRKTDFRMSWRLLFGSRN